MQAVYPVPSSLAARMIPSYLAFFMKVLIKQISLYKALLCLLVKHPLAPLILKTCPLCWSRRDKWKHILIILADLG